MVVPWERAKQNLMDLRDSLDAVLQGEPGPEPGPKPKLGPGPVDPQPDPEPVEPQPEPTPVIADFRYDGEFLYLPRSWYTEQGVEIVKWERWRMNWQKVAPSFHDTNPVKIKVWVPELNGHDAMFFQFHTRGGRFAYEPVCVRGEAWGRPPPKRLVVYTAPGAAFPATHDQALFDQVGENEAGKKWRLMRERDEGPVPRPPVPRPPSEQGVFVRGASSWDHGKPGYTFAGPANYTYDSFGRAAGVGRHFLSIKWSKNERFSRRQQAEQCRRAKGEGFSGINIDLENKLFYERGYVEEWVDTIQAAGGLTSVCCPKATLGELSGNPFPAIGRHDPHEFVKYMKRIGFQAMMPWAYGGYGLHVNAYKICRQYFPNDSVCLLHDSFREWNGYMGQHEWPKLVAWARGFPVEERPLLGLFEQRKEIAVRGKAEYEATIRELDALYG